MKLVDLATLSIPRLKAYRKSLMAKIGPYEHCDCGGSGCDNERERNKNNPVYLSLKLERERVNIALGAKQKAEREAKPKEIKVERVGEYERKYGKRK